MATRLTDDDIEFACIYGEQCRGFYGKVPFSSVVNDMQRGWFRVRGDDRLAWQDVERYVHVGWKSKDLVSTAMEDVSQAAARRRAGRSA